MTLAFFAFILLPSAVSFAQEPATATPELSLRAFHGDRPIWRMDVGGLLSENQRCHLHFEGVAAHRPLTVIECAGLAELLRQTVKLRSEKVEPLIHEPRYEFEIGGKHYSVNFRAPEICTIKQNGVLDCKPNRLTDLQSALLILRPYAPVGSSR